MSGNATAVRAGFEIDEGALAAWLVENVDGFAGPLVIEQFSGGQSNPTFRLTTPNAGYVLRRKPVGTLLRGAHAVEREYRVLRAVAKAGIPVPRVHALCTDEAVIGSWFYVMDLVEGRIFWDGGFPDAARGERAELQASMGRVLADLHRLDPAEVGLADYGRHDGYLERQVARWSSQYRDDELAGRTADMDFLVDWLPANLPPEGAVRIVHGDYRVDNVVFDPAEPKVTAVLDWELSTLGDPLADFAYNLMMYRVPSAVPWGLADRDLSALGLPDENAYVAAYCERTGRDGIPDLDVYLAFNLFRLAAIIHGITGRMIRGTAASADAGAMVERMNLLAATAKSIARSVGG